MATLLFLKELTYNEKSSFFSRETMLNLKF